MLNTLTFGVEEHFHVQDLEAVVRRVEELDPEQPRVSGLVPQPSAVVQGGRSDA